MSEWIVAATTDELKPGEAKILTAGAREIALFNVDGKFYALDNACPHRGGPLGKGRLEDHEIVCPWHGWRFDVRSGVSPLFPTVSVDRFEVKVEGNEVKVKVR
ncbi:MAG: non-heme iron oxygenase ferredoxin subunit [Verrucomicrobiae bacterium]|nr:non-heme iron oxygenase ferredoxin subunit [Verrucomicrobiae bacterium]